MSEATSIFVTGMGVVCAGAGNVGELRRLLLNPTAPFQAATSFPLKHPSGELPVAQAPVGEDGEDSALPRTHRLALQAAREAIGEGPFPDAIVIGCTTGGIAATEQALDDGETSPAAYRFHGLDTVALQLASTFSVPGPVITICTACSSATAALAVGAGLLRAGLSRRILCGGADSLCRLTFHGFRQLQLVAPDGCAPLDVNRAGMTVGEGAGFLVLSTTPGAHPVIARLTGAGLSCDAYHATSPHPEGAGAVLAIERALADAGLEPAAVGYVNLHGTGTPDNDAAEARAIRQVFAATVPALSSTKGLTGHALAAAGGIEAVISLLALQDGLLPGNTRLTMLDEKLGIEPLRTPTAAEVATVMSNSFGFGGNNACVIFEAAAPPAPAAAPWSRPAQAEEDWSSRPRLPSLRVAATAALTARGDLAETFAALLAGDAAAGFVPDRAFAGAVPAAFVRRLRRLPRLMLALAQSVQSASGRAAPPGIIAAGTAWGPLAETWEFLRKLFESGDQFSSPMDFVGSVHNAPAGQIALLLGSQAPNLTCSSGERSWSQALLCASMQIAAGADSALVLAAEAFEPKLSPLFEPATAQGPLASDGGAAFYLVPEDGAPGARLRWLGEAAGPRARDLVTRLGPEETSGAFDAVLVGAPANYDLTADQAVATLVQVMPHVDVIDCRNRLGQHASVGATAAAIAARAIADDTLPFPDAPPLHHRRLLLLEFGSRLTAVEVSG
jgi:3-oxoacyl-(acyl-carrier-protein) synthase